MPTDLEWKKLWFDLKVNAKANFESESTLLSRYNNLGTISCIGSSFSGASILLDIIFNLSTGNIAMHWLRFTRTNTTFAKIMPSLFLGCITINGFIYFSGWNKTAIKHRSLGRRYNVLARRVESAILNKDIRNDDYFKEITKERDQIEISDTPSIENHVINYAKAVVLQRKVQTAEPPSPLIKYKLYSYFFGSEQEKTNKTNKDTLLKCKLESWK